MVGQPANRGLPRKWLEKGVYVVRSSSSSSSSRCCSNNSSFSLPLLVAVKVLHFT